MKVKIKKLNPDAVIPTYSKNGDAGMDLVAISRKVGGDGSDYIEYGTGISVEIPEGYVGLLFPRSSNSNKNLTLTNSVGVIDSGYRGEVKLRFKLDTTYQDLLLLDGPNAFCSLFGVTCKQSIYEVNDRVGQLIILPYPKIEFEEVEELSETERGEGGYGSSGK